jgi:hypothetical protein
MKKILILITSISLIFAFCSCSKDEPSGMTDENFFSSMKDITKVTMSYKGYTDVSLDIIDILLDSDFERVEGEKSDAETGQQAHVLKFYDDNGECVYLMQYYPEDSDDDTIEALFILGPDNAEVRYTYTYEIENKELVESLQNYEDKVQFRLKE